MDTHYSSRASEFSCIPAKCTVRCPLGHRSRAAFRLIVPDLWLDVMQRIKALGFNAISMYTYWGIYNPAPGVMDIDGWKDFEPFIEAANEAGLWVVARPGPYIVSERVSSRLIAECGSIRWRYPRLGHNAQHDLANARPCVDRCVRAVLEGHGRHLCAPANHSRRSHHRRPD